MTNIELRKKTTEEMIEALIFDVSLNKVLLKKLQEEVEELKNGNGK